MGMAFTAVADDYSAAFYNPAGLTQVNRAKLTLKLSCAKARFHLSNRNALLAYCQEYFNLPPAADMVRRSLATGDMPDASAFTLGFAADMDYLVGMKDLALGLAMYIPFGQLAETPVVFRADTIPHFVRYVDSLQGMDLHFGLGYRILSWISVGVGIHVFLNMEGETFLDAVILDPADIRNRSYMLPGLNRQLVFALAPIGSLLVKPTEWLRVGVTYRGSNKAKTHFEQYMNVGLALPDPDPLAERAIKLIEASVPFDYTLFFTPQSVTGGIALRPMPTLLLSLDLAWYQYSAFIDGKGNLPSPPFSDIYVPRIGVDWEVLQRLHIYGGYFFEPSPVPAQTTRNNYLDMDRHVFSCGIHYTIPGIGKYWKKPLSFQGLVQGQYFQERNIEKADPALYGPSYEIDGYLIQAAIAIVFHY